MEFSKIMVLFHVNIQEQYYNACMKTLEMAEKLRTKDGLDMDDDDEEGSQANIDSVDIIIQKLSKENYMLKN